MFATITSVLGSIGNELVDGLIIISMLPAIALVTGMIKLLTALGYGAATTAVEAI